MKKYVKVLLCFLLTMSLCGCSTSNSDDKNTSETIQTATATKTGYKGPIEVTISVENNKLVEVTATGNDESLIVGTDAIDQLPITMIEQNNIEVDSLSGATITSAAIKSAAKDALKQLGLANDDLVHTEPDQLSTETIYADVIVIGGGGAGISAAVAALENGAEVVMIEKLSILGGNTALSGGVMTRPAIQGDPEGSMTNEELFNFYIEKTGGLADEAVIKTYVDNAAEDLQWIHNMGSGIHGTQKYQTNPNNIMAIQSDLQGGRGLLAPMIEEVRASDVNIIMDTTVTNIIMEDNKAIGVKATRKNGEVQEIYASNGVIVATGGFPASPELIAKHSFYGAEKAITISSIGTVGDGIVMGEEINAAIKFADNWDTIGAQTNIIIGETTFWNSILVNDSGERFTAEDQQLPQVFNAMIRTFENGNNSFKGIFDSNTVPAGVDALIENGQAFKADTIEELAALINIDPSTLNKTVEQYNSLESNDTDFNKLQEHTIALNTAPYYAINTHPFRSTTIGGLVINEHAEVLDNEANPITNLYAGGEVANYSFFNSVYATCGSAVGHAIVFGRIAGENAANNITE